MNYFLILGIVMGTVALLKPVYMHLIPWDENRFIAKAYAEKRPAWVIVVALIGLGLVGLTWYLHFTSGVAYSLVITLLFSLTAVKGLTLLLDYQRFQQWVAGMLRRDGGRQIVWIDVGVSLIGLVMIAVSVWLYA
jgi:hypothetical protein|uniref:Uncharacterized protein n=1 Tax=Caldilinea aerophila TaxID=133453 RepID=A0A7C1FSW5_9CHLR